MDLKHQVNSFDQAKELHGLGLRTGANFYYGRDGKLMSRDCAKEIMSRPIFKENPDPFYPGYTSAELGCMLPPYSTTRYMEAYQVWKIDITINGVDIYETGPTEAITRASLLLRLISKDKYNVTVDEVKERLINVSNLQL
jgi:hypothetical protein